MSSNSDDNSKKLEASDDNQCTEKSNVTCSRGRQLSESLDDNTGKRQRTISNSSDGDNQINLGGNAASPPKFVSLEEVTSAVKDLTNMAIANEIALNSDFQLKLNQPVKNSLENRVTEMMYKAYWEQMAENLKKDPPDCSRYITLIREVKEILFSVLLPKQHQFRDAVNRVLDIDDIQQKANDGCLDFYLYSKFILSIMEKICAPVRDERIRQLKEMTDVLEIYKGIMETLREMKVDMVNFAIKVIRPGIVDYEKTQFKKYLDGLSNSPEEKLKLTKAWLQANVDPTKPNQTKIEILNKAFMQLVEDDNDHMYDIETMMGDGARFMQLRNECNRLSVIAAILLVTLSSVSPALSDIADFRKQLKEHICLLIVEKMPKNEIDQLLPNICEQVIKDSKEFLEKHHLNPLSKDCENILTGQISEIAFPHHKIRQIARKRIHEFLSSSVTTDKPTRLQIPSGLTAIQNELGALAKRFVQTVSHNKAVCDEVYDDLLSSLLSARK